MPTRKNRKEKNSIIDSKAKEVLGKKKVITSTNAIGAKEIKKAVKVLKKNNTLREPKKAFKPRNFSFTGLDGKKYTLTPQQKEFAEYFCEFSMNGTQAIIKSGYNVFGKKGAINYSLAAVLSSENLRKPNICAYIDTLLDKYGLTDDHVDKQLLFVINQHSDIGAKIRAIDVYYKKKGSYAAEKVEHSLDKKLEEFLDNTAKKLK